jgi:hypothetical protein
MDIQTNFTIQKQVIGVEFKSLNIVKHVDGTIAYILFNLLFDDNTSSLTEVKLEKEKFNNFWENFDTTLKLYETFFTEINQTFVPPTNVDMDETIINNLQQ